MSLGKPHSLDFLGKLVALVPPPRFNTIRFHGVYAPHAKLRSEAVPPQEEDDKCCVGEVDQPPGTRNYRLSWARLMARVFAIDVLECPRCQTPGMQVIAWITQPRKRAGRLIHEEPVVVFTLAHPDDVTAEAARQIRAFLHRLGRETNQGEIGVVIEGHYWGITQYDPPEDQGG